jgi:hypothetical protein
MTSILIVEKTGSVKSLKAKDVDYDNLYKKAGFRSPDGFVLQTTWPDSKISVYGKTAGKAGQENKYDFPPPIDTVLFFGACVLVKTGENGKIVDLSEEEWNKVYEHLFGGFEDLGEDEGEEEEIDTEEEIENMKKSGQVVQLTKQGYLKDDFIVDDEEEEEEEEEEYKPKPKKRVKTTTIKVEIKKVAKKSKKEPEPKKEDTETYLDCTSELKEEDYV